MKKKPAPQGTTINHCTFTNQAQPPETDDALQLRADAAKALAEAAKANAEAIKAIAEALRGPAVTVHNEPMVQIGK